MAVKGFRWLLILAGLGVALMISAVFLRPYLEGRPPAIDMERTPSHLGRDFKLALKVSDEGTGLASLRVRLMQGSRAQVLLDKTFAPSPPVTSQSLEVVIKPREQGLSDGKATLELEASDRSWRNWFHGSRTRLSLPVIIDTVPPRITLTSKALNITRGGSALVVYQLDKPVERHGVRLGGHLFAGYAPWPQRPQTMVCVFAYGQDQERSLSAQLWAQDQAGNQAVRPLPLQVRWKKFPHTQLNISDNFLAQVLPRFQDVTPKDLGSPVAVFNWINSDLRKRNNQQIRQAALESTGRQYWLEAFERPNGKTMAGFAGRRSYRYQGKEIGRSIHLGVDVADVTNAPIRAAAPGRVTYQGPLGIYGNVVILDHGLGVATLYGHLAEFAVAKGDSVQKGQLVGRSGATGLALGDHLHFAVLVGGVFVAPVEWWDPHWQQDRVFSRLAEAGLGQADPSPGPSGGPEGKTR